MVPRSGDCTGGPRCGHGTCYRLVGNIERCAKGGCFLNMMNLVKSIPGSVQCEDRFAVLSDPKSVKFCPGRTERPINM